MFWIYDVIGVGGRSL